MEFGLKEYAKEIKRRKIVITSGLFTNVIAVPHSKNLTRKIIAVSDAKN